MPGSSTLVCAHCGRVAATLAYDPEQGAIRVSGWRFGGQTIYGDVSIAARLAGLIEAGDLPAAARLAPDLLGFWCAACSAVYCDTCWDIGSPQYDTDLPGFYDLTMGVCPAGHESVVDD